MTIDLALDSLTTLWLLLMSGFGYWMLLSRSAGVFAKARLDRQEKLDSVMMVSSLFTMLGKVQAESSVSRYLYQCVIRLCNKSSSKIN